MGPSLRWINVSIWAFNDYRMITYSSDKLTAKVTLLLPVLEGEVEFIASESESKYNH